MGKRILKIQEIFTPNDTPTITYVDRSEHKLEQTLRDHYSTPRVVVSVSGPSKSGKTVLIKKVVPQDYLISVVGAGISSPENLWERVLGWMGTPSETTVTKSASNEVSGEVAAGGKVKVPFVAEGEGSTTVAGGRTWGKETSETYKSDSLPQVIKEIAESEFVVFVDDFHYIRPELRDEIGKQIKVAAESGVKIFTASVPHRADDVVRSNPELRGRVAAVDLKYWTSEELIQIARKGFEALNVELSSRIERKLADEAFGSPQLMQTICLNLCYTIPIRERLPELQRVEVTEDQITEAFLKTSSFTDFSKMVESLHTGPRSRGTERKLHEFKDESSGDVYRAILLAIKNDPAKLSFSYEEILNRVRSNCVSETPAGSSVSSALEQMNTICENVQPGTSPLSWDGDRLDITDPYLLFFLRCSASLDRLAMAR